MTWNNRSFHELTAMELYDILRLRNEVFVVEQNCVYLDTDQKDKYALHIWCGSMDTPVVAYCRLLPPGLSYPQASIGRVVVHPGFRKQGFGRRLMQEAIRQSELLFQTNAIVISAQYHLSEFYQSLDFKEEGSVYLEDGIQHIQMSRIVALGKNTPTRT